MEDITKRRLIVFGLVAVLLLVVGLLLYENLKPKQVSVPMEAITIPEVQTERVGIVDGLDNLRRSGLSDRQTREIEAALNLFIETLQGETIFTVDISTAKEVFNNTDNYYIYSFNVTSGKGMTYRVDTLHISSDDALVQIYDASGNFLFTPPNHDH